ncbi:EVI5-like protein [Vidua chalybeata]|uniref:EVI5-like protein n=1 Tax=Vidua chalybeata TaxID=81927 RepID=UPI0023A83DA1|nr:EVI5-like protein [Vidua chalybeata]
MASPAGSPGSWSLEGPSGSPAAPGEALSPDELQLLAKLEEQNRLLEADSKSMRSVNGSRRNSGSSLVSSSSASSNLSHLEEDTWILWGRIVNEWDEWRKKKEKLLKELIRKGIPQHFRAIVWQLLCSAAELPLKAQYSELLRMSSPCERLIRRDIARTYPEHDFFKGQDSLGQEVLFNVMKAYSLVDREVGYCQGSAFIVGLLLMQMPEEEAFSVFVRLMQQYRLRELFKPSMAELGLCIYQFEFLLQEQLPELNVHFRSQSFLTSMYASSWFLTLFLTTFPLPVATRVFDIFMYEGLEIVFRVGMALLQFNQAELVQLDMEGMSQYFQKVIPHQFDSCPDQLILRACQVKYNPRRMKRLEKEYAALKSKEMEEQIEIKRLRSENRLLKQRIETLEKESAALADRLIQGQVTRAQEAEENDVIRRELALVRQRCSSATESLRRAQSTIRELQQRCSSATESLRRAQSTIRELQGNPRLSEEFVAHLETELERSRLRESETLGALKEMQDKVLDMEKRQPLLPDESSVVRLQEELQELALSDIGDSWQVCGGRWKEPRALHEAVLGVQLRESQAQVELRALRQRVLHLETQGRIQRSVLGRAEQACAGLREQGWVYAGFIPVNPGFICINPGFIPALGADPAGRIQRSVLGRAEQACAGLREQGWVYAGFIPGRIQRSVLGRAEQACAGLREQGWVYAGFIWGRIQRSVLGRAEQACAGLREQLRAAAAQSQGLQAQLSESHRKHAEAQCKSKEEVMAVRLREADSMAALAEMRQRVAELEIQREEGRLQGQLEHSDAAQYIRHLQGHIRQLKAEIRLLRGPLSFGAVALGTRLGDEDSLGSSDEELPPPFALTPGDIGDTGDTGDSSDSEPEVAPTAP